MQKRPNPERVDDENPEWTDADFARARPAAQMLPHLLGEEAARTMLKPKGSKSSNRQNYGLSGSLR